MCFRGTVPDEAGRLQSLCHHPDRLPQAPIGKGIGGLRRWRAVCCRVLKLITPVQNLRSGSAAQAAGIRGLLFAERSGFA